MLSYSRAASIEAMAALSLYYTLRRSHKSALFDSKWSYTVLALETVRTLVSIRLRNMLLPLL